MTSRDGALGVCGSAGRAESNRNDRQAAQYPIAAAAAADGVGLPANKPVELEPSKSHLLLRDAREVIRGGDLMKFTMRFEKAGSITFNIQSEIPAHHESPSPIP